MAEKESRKVATRGCINSHPSTTERQEMLADAQRSLLHASGLGDVPSLSAALDAGAQINLLDDSGYNALHRAGAGGHTAAIARLLDRKANVALRDAQGGCTALHHACTFGSIHAVAALLQPNQKHVDATDDHGETALMACALHGHDAIVERLLKCQADPSAVDNKGGSALMRASNKGNLRSAELLLAHKAAVDAQDSDGESALHAAAYKGHVEVINALLRHGADPALVSSAGHTAADIATELKTNAHAHCAWALRSAEVLGAQLAQRVNLGPVEGGGGGGGAPLTALERSVQSAKELNEKVDMQEEAVQQAILKADAERVVDVSEDTTEEKPTGETPLVEMAQKVAPIDVSGGDCAVYKKLLKPSKEKGGEMPATGMTIKCRYTIAVVEVPNEAGEYGAEAAGAELMAMLQKEGKVTDGVHPLIEAINEAKQSKEKQKQRVMDCFNEAAQAGGVGMTKRVIERSNFPVGEFVLSSNTHEDVPPEEFIPLAIHLGVSTMRRGETSSFVVRPDYAYGWEGIEEKGVPANTPVTILIELVDFLFCGSKQDALNETNDEKALGGSLFKEGKWQAAMKCYENGVRLLGAHAFSYPPRSSEDRQAHALHSACLSNQTMCLLKLERWADAAECAGKVLQREENNAKALYRRGLALLELGSFREAFDDLKLAVKHEPKSREVRTAYQRAKEGVANSNEREKSIFGGKKLFEKALEGYHEEETNRRSANTLEEEMKVMMAASTPRGTAGNGGKPPGKRGPRFVQADKGSEGQGGPTIPPVEIDKSFFGGDSTFLENEKVIADARLEENEGNLTYGGDSGTNKEEIHTNKLRLRSMMDMGGEGPEGRYKWGQTESSICVIVPVGSGTKAKHVQWKATSSSIKLHVCDLPILEGELHASILPDDSTYQIDVDENGTTLKVSLEKMLKTKAKYHWPCVVKGEAVIDVAAFGEPVHSIDENSKEDVQKYMRMMDDAKEGKLDLSQEVGFVAGQDADSGMLYYDE